MIRALDKLVYRDDHRGIQHMSYLTIESALDYRQAELTFRIDITLLELSQGGASILITPINTSTGADISITDEASPVLSDFAPALARWMRTCRITATVQDKTIVGTFNQNTTIQQIFQSTHDICDLIDQRFSMYTESVLS